MTQLNFPLETTQFITLGTLVGEGRFQIEYYWDFLWQLGYSPHVYDRKFRISLGDLAVGMGATDALRQGRLFGASGNELVLCTIPMVRRAVSTSRLAEQFALRLSAMEQSLLTGDIYVHSRMAKPEPDDCDDLIYLAYIELISAMSLNLHGAVGCSLGRAAAWSAAGISRVGRDTECRDLRAAERQRQQADVLKRFPTVCQWPGAKTSELNQDKREVRFRRYSQAFPFPGNDYYEPVLWPIDNDRVVAAQ